MRILQMLLLGTAVLMAVFVLMARDVDSAQDPLVCFGEAVDQGGVIVTFNLFAIATGLGSAPPVTFFVLYDDGSTDVFFGIPDGPDQQKASPLPSKIFQAPGDHIVTVSVVVGEEACQDIFSVSAAGFGVGGIAEVLVDGSGSSLRTTEGSGFSGGGYAALAMGAAAAALTLMLVGWYARRRWLR